MAGGRKDYSTRFMTHRGPARADDRGAIFLPSFGRVLLVVSLAVLAAPELSSMEHGVSPDFYLRATTGIAVNPTEQLKERYEIYDWTAGLDLGLGMRIGLFHTVAAAGIRYSTPYVLAITVASWIADKSAQTADTSWVGDLPAYADFPLRFYAGFDISKWPTTRIDAFWGWYLRASKADVPHRVKDFEAGIALSRKRSFMEASYIWPQMRKLRLSLGGHLGF